MAVGPDKYRQTLRKFASGITVVTVVEGDGFHGMTASSFAAVSLLPPQILVCLEKTTRTRGLVLEAGAFGVNLLADHQEKVARAFSQPGAKPFAELKYKIGETGAPLLDGAIAWIECNIAQVHDAGDHDVVIGEVISCERREGFPLVYFDHAYRSLRT